MSFPVSSVLLKISSCGCGPIYSVASVCFVLWYSLGCTSVSCALWWTTSNKVTWNNSHSYFMSLWGWVIWLIYVCLCSCQLVSLIHLWSIFPQPTLNIVQLFNVDWFNMYWVIPYCHDLFHVDYWVWSSLHMLISLLASWTKTMKREEAWGKWLYLEWLQ